MTIIHTALEATTAPLPVLFNLTDWILGKYQFSPNSPWYFIIFALCILACTVIPYLIGSINPAILISREVYHEDIREYGSGNAGSTNMLRTYGKKAAGLTFLADFLKAVIACFWGLLVWEMDGLGLAGFFVILGHMYPVFEKFKGGKGVACLCAVVLITSIFTNNWIAPFIPFTFIFLALVFFIVVLGTQYVSMASVTGAFLYPILLKTLSNGAQARLCIAMAALCGIFVIYKHKENLKRIYNRTESKVSFKKTSKKKIDQNTSGDQS